MTATFNRQAHGTVGVVGLGCTGLPLALSLAGAGLLTIGLDIDRAKISALRDGRSYLPDVADDELVATADWFEPTADATRLTGLDVYVICVPTPTGDPSCLAAAADTVAPLVRAGALVVLQPTVAPGTTRELARRLADGSGLVAGVDFHVTTAPEHIAPRPRVAAAS